MSNETISNLPNLDSQESIEKQQETILVELKMILETVKNIDTNIAKSIELLQEPNSTDLHDSNGNTVQIDLNHNDLIRKNIETISEILGMLESL